MPEIKERAFEDAIVNVLTTGRMDGTQTEIKERASGFGEYIPGGYTHERAQTTIAISA